jgi:peptidoglycan/LPS O-acetylase OafA/YrhL
MWTVSYEFRCYLLVMLLGVLGVLRNRRLYLALTAFLFLFVLRPLTFLPSPTVVALFGWPDLSLRFAVTFLCGGVFYLFRDRIRYRGALAFVAAIALIPLMYIPRLAGPAVITIGAYVLFSFAFAFKSRALGRVGSKVDLSYGAYLYAWPIQGLLIWHYPRISPWVLFLLSTMAAGCCAFVSWTAVEKPLLSLKGRFARPRRADPAVSSSVAVS